jgi:hypothetical protein
MECQVGSGLWWLGHPFHRSEASILSCFGFHNIGLQCCMHVSPAVGQRRSLSPPSYHHQHSEITIWLFWLLTLSASHLSFLSWFLPRKMEAVRFTVYYLRWFVMGWIVTPPKRKVEVLTPIPQKVTLFENRVIADVLSLGHTGVGGLLIQYIWCIYKEKEDDHL